ncbi:cellulose synthase/poly-beta-1,6-N-acetylglucosamine synthase-like glycosyltransferase [Alicyclobacillus cycloheptanicus]|uniref:Cellulose synthase/poly-beta-1,6-N-acetylglucosamine synthase-like glycosyltransferase n=2 Tax=Alicyclobacillus cycloheptanicus TaxID=1457 RepID=A0ABT9XFF8_9BACL|nr:glycosyltransferase family 2 protein [Alicyclobacillus cycloheptanicus]MDQ0189000.1 cellulose synthase/poly-beta-1,6-N-acetylglucosamine synthase-like glycosyltransferase [Alicyclobacillus cycloheptanicus]
MRALSIHGLSLQAFINFAYFLMQVLTGMIGVYQMGTSLFGIWHRQKPLRYAPKHRFAVIVPAHNEERVIGPLIDSLKAQHYPADLFDIHVVADNCTDHTREVALRHGAAVHVRVDRDHCGKGYVIQWMLERLWRWPVSYDAVVLFDADNLVAPDFLQIMNDRLCEGHPVIQGYLGVKNPFDSWVSVCMAISYWYSNRMWQNARQNLGLSCSLGGTGLCMDMSLLRRLGWQATGLTEDLEFGVRCVEHGIVPIWAHDAKVYDEKPITLLASMRQRLRWMQGHFQCAKSHMLPLLKAGVRERNFLKLDAGIYLFQPMRFLILFLTSIMLLLHISGPHETLLSHVTAWLPTDFWVIVNVFLYLQIPLALFLERVNWRAYFGLILLPFFLWTWGPVVVRAYFTKANRTWVHTVHNRSIRFDQLKSN